MALKAPSPPEGTVSHVLLLEATYRHTACNSRALMDGCEPEVIYSARHRNLGQERGDPVSIRLG